MTAVRCAAPSRVPRRLRGGAAGATGPGPAVLQDPAPNPDPAPYAGAAPAYARAAYLSAAFIIARAVGAASPLPETSLRAACPSSTITATATRCPLPSSA